MGFVSLVYFFSHYSKRSRHVLSFFFVIPDISFSPALEYRQTLYKLNFYSYNLLYPPCIRRMVMLYYHHSGQLVKYFIRVNRPLNRISFGFCHLRFLHNETSRSYRPYFYRSFPSPTIFPLPFTVTRNGIADFKVFVIEQFLICFNRFKNQLFSL